MSLGYAEKLSFIEDVGQVGMAEFFDTSHALQDKVRKFLPLKVVVFVVAVACYAVYDKHFLMILFLLTNGTAFIIPSNGT